MGDMEGLSFGACPVATHRSRTVDHIGNRYESSKIFIPTHRHRTLDVAYIKSSELDGACVVHDTNPALSALIFMYSKSRSCARTRTLFMPCV